MVLTGSIGAMAYVFADYGTQLWTLPPEATAWIAAGVVLGLSGLNLLGLVVGKVVQNLLTGAKVAGLLGVVLAGLIWGRSGILTAPTPAADLMGPGLGLALGALLALAATYRHPALSRAAQEA